MDTLEYILKLYDLKIPRHSEPIEIPDMGRDKCINPRRPDLATLFHVLGFKVGAEVGTEAGKYAEILCSRNPDLRLYCIDKYEDYPFYRDYINKQNILNDARAIWKNRMAPYNAALIEGYSMDVVKTFADGSLDFVYIDANHELPFVTEDIFYWSRKVRAGGIIAGHDFYETKSVNSRCHVIPAVFAYTRAFWIKPWFIIGTKAIEENEVRDRSRSWMWVKDASQP